MPCSLSWRPTTSTFTEDASHMRSFGIYRYSVALLSLSSAVSCSGSSDIKPDFSVAVELLGAPSGFTVVRDPCAVWISDEVGSVVRRIGCDGLELDTVARPGNQPGAVRRPTLLFQGKESGVFVWDQPLQRVNRFSAQGAFQGFDEVLVRPEEHGFLRAARESDGGYEFWTESFDLPAPDSTVALGATIDTSRMRLWSVRKDEEPSLRYGPLPNRPYLRVQSSSFRGTIPLDRLSMWSHGFSGRGDRAEPVRVSFRVGEVLCPELPCFTALSNLTPVGRTAEVARYRDSVALALRSESLQHAPDRRAVIDSLATIFRSLGDSLETSTTTALVVEGFAANSQDPELLLRLASDGTGWSRTWVSAHRSGETTSADIAHTGRVAAAALNPPWLFTLEWMGGGYGLVRYSLPFDHRGIGEPNE